MQYICMGLLLSVGIIYAIKKNNISNLLSFYCFFWSVVVFLASLGLFGMIDVSWRPYFLIVLGSCGFILGYLVSRDSYGKIVKIGKTKLYNANYEEYEIRYNVAYTALIMVLLFYLYSLVKIIILIMNGTTYANIRTMILHGGEGNIERLYTNGENIFSEYIAVPSVFICIPLALIALVKRKPKKIFTILAFTDLMLYVACTGSRIILAIVIVQLLYLMRLYKIAIPKKVVRKIRNIIIIAVVAIVVISIVRRSEYAKKINYTIFQSYYSYLCLCIPLLDTWIDIIEKNSYITYGLASLKPLLSIPDVLFRRIGVSNLDSYYYTINILSDTEKYFWIFENKNYNAFVTIFFYFYLDFREIGVFFGSLFYGHFCGKRYKRVEKNSNLKNTLIFLLLLQGFIKMLVRWEFSINNYLLAFWFCRLFIKPLEEDRREVGGY